jgi:hypothetical protein
MASAKEGRMRMNQQQAMRFIIRNKEREAQARREKRYKNSFDSGFWKPIRKLITLLKA